MNRITYIISALILTLTANIFPAAQAAEPPFHLEWSFGAKIPNAHQEAAAAVVGNKIYVISGDDKDCTDYSLSQPTTAVDIYDTATDTFSAGPAVNLARDEYSVAATVGSSVYLIGGTGKCRYKDTTVRPVERLDLFTGLWTVLPPPSDLPASLDGRLHCGAAHGNQIYYFQQAGIGVFDTATNTWAVLPSSPLIEESFCQATTVGDQIVITGPGDLGYNQRILLFDVASGNVSLSSAMTLPLSEHVAGLVLGRVIVAGGDYAADASQYISLLPTTCIASADPVRVVTMFPMPDRSEDGVAGVVGNKFYVLGGNNHHSITPPVIIGTP